MERLILVARIIMMILEEISSKSVTENVAE